jgi:hypothetical protein
MPVRWDQDDDRRLITLVVTDPHTHEDILACVDRQAAEGLWHYARLVDMRLVGELGWPNQAIVKQRILKAGAGRPAGAVAMIVGNRPDWFREALRRSPAEAGLQDFEVLVTPEQVEDWIHRNTHHHATVSAPARRRPLAD